MGVFKSTTRTAVTEWIERMTSDRYKEDDFADIFELCEVINIQATGPKEAAKALKRAIKYGGVHTQIRAITILRYLTENCGEKFVAQIATYKFTDRLKNTAASPYTDPKVQKKLLALFAEWSTEFKGKPGYDILAHLNKSNSNNSFGYPAATRGSGSRSTTSSYSSPSYSSPSSINNNRERHKSGTSSVRSKNQQSTQPVTYSSERINEAMGLSTQNATNLINALTLLSPGTDLEANIELQELVGKCKSSSELLIKMIPTVTNGSQLGPLLQSNDQIQGALEIYSHYNDSKDYEVNSVTSGISNINLRKEKEDDVFGLGLNKKNSQAEEAAKIHKDFGDLIDFDAFSNTSNKNSVTADDKSDPFADPFADPEPNETANKPKRRLGWTEV